VVYIPEYVVGHWRKLLLHDQSALRLKARLLFQHGVMVTNMPWHLKSSDNKESADAVELQAANTGRRITET
jgi:hypothetical protein